jgi:hypothetical protein
VGSKPRLRRIEQPARIHVRVVHKAHQAPRRVAYALDQPHPNAIPVNRARCVPPPRAAGQPDSHADGKLGRRPFRQANRRGDRHQHAYPFRDCGSDGGIQVMQKALRNAIKTQSDGGEAATRE